MQSHPDAELRQRPCQLDEARRIVLLVPAHGPIIDITAVGARVLGNHQQLLDAAARERLRFAHDVIERPAAQAAAQRRDDAETATVVAALGDLQIRIVARREADALRRHEIDEARMRRRQMLAHGGQHALRGVRAGDSQHFGMALENALWLGTEAARDEHAPVALERLADGLQ